MMARFFFCLLALLPLAGPARASLDFKEWGLVAIQDGGRRKPVDTFARETVVKLTGRSTLKAFGRRWEPSEFILSMLLDTREWNKEPLILVAYRPLITQLGLDPSRHRFSMVELSHAKGLEGLVRDAHAMRDDQGGKPDRLHQEAEDLAGRMGLFSRVEKGGAFLLVPAPSDPKQAWVLPPDFADYYKPAQFDPIAQDLKSMASAYLAEDAFQFVAKAHEVRTALRQLSPTVYPGEKQLAVEYFYNHLHAFDAAALAYAIALAIFGFGVWFHVRKTGLVVCGLGAVGIGLLFHVAGMGLRCVIGGRPPVTNMYESMVWVSAGVIVFATLFFIRYRTTTYLLAALPMSLSLLVIVGQIPLLLPSNIDPLVPVLRDNFWLTVHVLTITLSYAAFALALGFGHILLFRYWRDPLQAKADADMHFWLYRILQLGVILLAAGTILGGVWANYSWGRFWGWDPKETWALITLLCYLLVLHGRIARWWGDFGLVLGSVLCFLSVIMAWYGVNFVLGTGLHSYGFGIGGERWVFTMVGLDILIVAGAVWRYLRRPVPVSPAAPGTI